MPKEEKSDSVDSPPKSSHDPKVRRISNKTPRKLQEKPEQQNNRVDDAPTKVIPSGVAESDSPDPKRSNRRRRGKGKAQLKEAGAPAPEKDEAVSTEVAQQGVPQQRPTIATRRKLDPEDIAKKAWKIYLAEVSEEGVALIADNDARDLARRCFRLAEIFMEEEARRN